MTCKHLRPVRDDRSTPAETAPETEQRCALKADRNRMVRMNSAHTRQVGASQMTTPKGCPFAAKGTFSECEWYQP